MAFLGWLLPAAMKTIDPPKSSRFRTLVVCTIVFVAVIGFRLAIDFARGRGVYYQLPHLIKTLANWPNLPFHLKMAFGEIFWVTVASFCIAFRDYRLRMFWIYLKYSFPDKNRWRELMNTHWWAFVTNRFSRAKLQKYIRGVQDNENGEVFQYKKRIRIWNNIVFSALLFAAVHAGVWVLIFVYG